MPWYIFGIRLCHVPFKSREARQTVPGRAGAGRLGYLYPPLISSTEVDPTQVRSTLSPVTCQRLRIDAAPSVLSCVCCRLSEDRQQLRWWSGLCGLCGLGVGSLLHRPPLSTGEIELITPRGGNSLTIVWNGKFFFTITEHKASELHLQSLSLGPKKYPSFHVNVYWKHTLSFKTCNEHIHTFAMISL